MAEQRFEIIAARGGRVDKYLAEQLSQYTRSHLAGVIQAGGCIVNGKAAKASHKLKEGDIISITIPEATACDLSPWDFPLDVLFEDRQLLVVNKPGGMVVHPSQGHHGQTLVNALLHHSQGKLSSINGVERPGIVHRLDMDTSGCLLVAKTDEAHKFLSAQFEARTVVREYIALVVGNVKTDEFTVDAPLARSKRDRKLMAVCNDGKQAITHVEVLERLGGYTLVKCLLETGRTHQIRVHLLHVGHPIAGDSTYGVREKNKSDMQLLHARKIGFVHPDTRLNVQFAAPMPEYFEERLINCRQRP